MTPGSVWALVAIIVCILVILIASAVAARRFGMWGGAEEPLDEPLDEENGSDLRASAREAEGSALQPHQALETEVMLKKHFTDPRLIVAVTAHASDIVYLRTIYPRASVEAVEVGPAAFSGPGAARPGSAVHVQNGVDFLRTTDAKAGFVYLAPPWGAGRSSEEPAPGMLKAIDLNLADAAGRQWDSSELVKLVFERGVAPYVVMKAPSSFGVAEFSSHIEEPIVVYPVGRSGSRDTGVSFLLIVVGGLKHSPPG